MKPEQFNTLNNINQSNPSAELSRQAQQSIASMQTPFEHPGMPEHFVIPELKDKEQDRFLLAVDGVQSGPFSVPEIVARINAGEITTDAYIWKSGMADWAKIKDYPGII